MGLFNFRADRSTEYKNKRSAEQRRVYFSQSTFRHDPTAKNHRTRTNREVERGRVVGNEGHSCAEPTADVRTDPESTLFGVAEPAPVGKDGRVYRPAGDGESGPGRRATTVKAILDRARQTAEPVQPVERRYEAAQVQI